MSAGDFYINSDKEWHDAVKQSAGVIWDEVEEAVQDGNDYDEAMSEALDGRAEAWTMYYADMRGILKWTDNIDAYFDVFGDDLVITESGGALMGLGPLAYYAFRQDVIDYMDRNYDLDELRDYDEDEATPATSVRRSMQRTKQPRKGPRKGNPHRTRSTRSADILRRFLKETT